MSLDDRLDPEKLGSLGVEVYDYQDTKRAILTDLLEIIGEDKKIIWDDYRENVQVDLAVRKRNQELRDKVRKYCE